MRQLSDKTILITGAYTEQGQSLLDALVAYHPFCIVSIDSRGETWQGDSGSTPWYDNYYISLGDLDALISVFRLRRPAIVVHLAQDYSDNPIVAFEHNCRGTFNLLMAVEAVKETAEAVLLYKQNLIGSEATLQVAEATVAASQNIAKGFYFAYGLPVMTLGVDKVDNNTSQSIQAILGVLENGTGGMHYEMGSARDGIMPVWDSKVYDDTSVVNAPRPKGIGRVRIVNY